MCLPFVAAGAAILGTTLSAGAATAINVGLTASLVAGLASSVVTAVGQQQQAKAAEDQGKYEAKVMRYEATLERQKGEVENIKFGINARREWGRFMLQNAGSSRDLSFGNAAQQAVEFRRFQAFDKDIISRNVEARVTTLNMSANNARIRGQNQAAGLRLASIGTSLNAVGNVASRFFSYSQLGSSSVSNADRFSGFDLSSSYDDPSAIAGGMGAFA